jgi:hypothetical protein
MSILSSHLLIGCCVLVKLSVTANQKDCNDAVVYLSDVGWQCPKIMEIVSMLQCRRHSSFETTQKDVIVVL